MVQGVGFRPFLQRLADRLGFSGTAFNTAGGVVLDFNAANESEAQHFAATIQSECPPAARVDRCEVILLADDAEYQGFHILASHKSSDAFTLVSADLATCADCLSEIRDPDARRFGYAFTNCTNCGPRYSITYSTPYDRANTTMRRFPLCVDCTREYCDVGDRRFHAQPIACPVCGPQLSVDLKAVRRSLRAGQIVAIKGLGGYQLACDALSADAVKRLRERKRRRRKPFALMMRDLETVGRYCHLSEAESEALMSVPAPIVLLQLLSVDAFPPELAPGLLEVGVMLPYTPLHHLLFNDEITCLVMTSGNLSEEPIVISNEEAHAKLPALADELVTHNRDIFMRVDDSVARVFEGTPRVLRRARGLAPEAITLATANEEVLACGGELKNTFCFTRDRYAILSQHIGDLENYETLQFFEETWRNLQTVYRAQPRLIAHDLHPDYLSTRWAQDRPEPKIAVQHHHAHIASCMAENNLSEAVIGVAFDGTGLGTDGHVWGGEFLVCDYSGFERLAHLRYVPLPGGDVAAREPWRMAAAYLFDALGPEARRFALPPFAAAPIATWNILEQLVRKPTVLTSSCGRFDAVASLCGISQENSFEGESAMLLEAAAAGVKSDDQFPIDLHTDTNPWIIDSRPMIRQMVHEIVAGRAPHSVARCFHNSLGHMIDVVCSTIRGRNGLNKVCLSGGAFQNWTLLTKAVGLLRRSGFQVYLHAKVPPNDGGLSLGQAVIAAYSLRKDLSDVPRHSR